MNPIIILPPHLRSLSTAIEGIMRERGDFPHRLAFLQKLHPHARHRIHPFD